MTSSHLNCLIVGLSGVTNGGKTTLANKLAAHFKPGSVEILRLDDFFFTDTSRLDYVPELNHWDFDKMNSLDWDGYYAAVQGVIDRFSANAPSSSTGHTPRPNLIILDGFLLFNEPRLLALCHLKYDFTLPYSVAKHRRATRVYDPPDVPGYFDQVAWPAYERHREEIDAVKRTEGIETVDGTEEVERIFERVLKDIDDALKR